MIENGASEKTGGGGGYVQPFPINKSLAADRTERPTLVSHGRRGLQRLEVVLFVLHFPSSLFPCLLYLLKSPTCLRGKRGRRRESESEEQRGRRRKISARWRWKSGRWFVAGGWRWLYLSVFTRRQCV